MADGTDDDSDDWIELVDAIEMVRRQLVQASSDGADRGPKAPTFTVGKVALEFSGEIKRMAGGSGGVKFWVLSADAKMERSQSATQKITVELVPHASDGTTFDISDQSDDLPPE